MARMRKGGRKVYRSMQGKQIDMDMLRKKNELTPAVGNARVNARGDELGPGGQIVRKREDIIKEYYKENPNAVAEQEPVSRAKQQEVVEEPEPEMQKSVKSKPKTRAQSKLESSEDWMEDDDGNFIPKSE